MTDESRAPGQVVPFARSAAYLRRRAAEHARKGRLMEAAELTRLAWQKDGRPETLFTLAERMRDMGCLRQSERMLYELCAEPDVPRGVYYLLGLELKAEGDRDGAVDALYHDLQQDPDSEQSDDARELLGELTVSDGEEESFRMPVLLRQGLGDVADGREETGLDKVKRALRLASRKGPVRVTLAMLDLALCRTEEGLRYAAAALREDPEDLRAWSVLCMLLAQGGKKRAARGVLRGRTRSGTSLNEDELIVATGRALDDASFVREYLEKRLRELPYATHLLHPMAETLWELGERQRAHATWERIVRIDPSDLRAYAMREWSREDRDEELPPEGSVPREILTRQMTELAEALARGTPGAELLRPGGRLRRLVDWAFTIPDGKLQGALVRYLGGQEGQDAAKTLRRLLTSPTVSAETKEEIMLCLARRGEPGPHPMLMGGRLVEASCDGTQQKPTLRWNTFLSLLLQETRKYGESMPIAFFAARAWKSMTPEQRVRATGQNAYVWIKAVEILYLLTGKREEDVRKCVDETVISLRRVERVLRALSRQMDLPLWQDEGEEK